MRVIIAVVAVWLSACDQGVVSKPKQAAASTAADTAKPAPEPAANGPFTAGAWSIAAPVLTLRRAQ